MFRAAVILACLQFVCPDARTADDAGSFVAYGLGARSCSAWIESRARNDTTTVRMMEWTLGFISAYNKYVHKGIDVADGQDADEIHASIDKHCRSRPFDSLSFATSVLIEQLNNADDSRQVDWLSDLFK